MAFNLDKAILKCKADCGFYGNPEWSGYCSVCYKKLNEQRLQAHIDQQEQEKRLQQGNQHHLHQVVNKLGFNSLVMSGYDQLTNLHSSILNTAKNSFKAATSPEPQLNETRSSAPPKSPRNILNFDRLSFKDFSSSRLSSSSSNDKQFSYDVAWVDCLKSVNRFAKNFLEVERKGLKSLNELSDMVYDFYQQSKRNFETNSLYKNATSEQIELMTDNMERILNEHIYTTISSRIMNEDEESNIAMQKRIKSLQWITIEHLDIEMNLDLPTVHNLLDKAICQMIEINSKLSSIDKLDCIVQCSKTISELLKIGNIIPVSADQFLPLLVFVLIQANPPMLPADIKYLNRFSNPSRLLSGETGYYFTNLCCALEFIEKATGESLNIPQEEFESYLNGQAIPKKDNKYNTYFCDVLRITCSNEVSLKKLAAQREIRSEKMKELSTQIDVYLESTKARVSEMDRFMQSIDKNLAPLASSSKDNVKPTCQEYLPLYLKKKEM